MKARLPNDADVAHAVVRRIGLGELRELAGEAAQSKAPLSTMHAADRGTVTADELRRRMDVTMFGAELDRVVSRYGVASVLSTISGRPCRFACGFGDRFDVEDVDARVADRLGEDRLRIFAD